MYEHSSPNPLDPEYPRCINPRELTLNHDPQEDSQSHSQFPLDPELEHGYMDLFSYDSSGRVQTMNDQEGTGGRHPQWNDEYARPPSACGPPPVSLLNEYAPNGYAQPGPSILDDGWIGSPSHHDYSELVRVPAPLAPSSLPHMHMSRWDPVHSVNLQNDFDRNATPVMHHQYAFRESPEDYSPAPFGNPFPMDQRYMYDGQQLPMLHPQRTMSFSPIHPSSMIYGQEGNGLNGNQGMFVPEKSEDPTQRQIMENRKPTRPTKQPTKITLKELEHDNSRFAKVVKAFISIDDSERRTVPEIASRVFQLYGRQYNDDFEGVKRMVNDVLQKHKAFEHKGRGTPYTMNLDEGRARREFPSSRKHKNENSPYFFSRPIKNRMRDTSPRARRGRHIHGARAAEYENPERSALMNAIGTAPEGRF